MNNQLWDPVTTGAYAGEQGGTAMVLQCTVNSWKMDGTTFSTTGQGTFQKLRSSNTRFRLQVDGEDPDHAPFVFRFPFPYKRGVEWDILQTQNVMTRNGGGRPRYSLVNDIEFRESDTFSKIQVVMPLVRSNVALAKLFRPAVVHADQMRRGEHVRRGWN